MPYGYGDSQARYTGLMNKKKKPFSIAGQESNFFPPPQTQYQPLTSGYQPGGAPSGGQHQGMPDMTKSGGGANQTKEMLEALGELTFDDPTPSNLGKPGGTGGGGFKLFPNSMVENRTPIGPFDEDEQRKRWWAMYGKIA
jgi:hypothetical protein